MSDFAPDPYIYGVPPTKSYRAKPSEVGPTFARRLPPALAGVYQGCDGGGDTWLRKLSTPRSIDFDRSPPVSFWQHQIDWPVPCINVRVTAQA